jgi:hypothetical protein
MQLELPTAPLPIKAVEPKVMILYGSPKVGKTTSLSQLPNCLIIDIEDGSDYVEALKIKPKNPDELKELGEALRAKVDRVSGKCPYDFIAVDTISKLEDWAEVLATAKYKKSEMGKNFNGASVLTLPNGGGYLWLRLAYQELIGYLSGTTKHLILVAHIREKLLDKGGREVSVKDVELTGKIRHIACSQADTVGYMHRQKDGLHVSFMTLEEVLCGSRSAYLAGKDFILDWKKIYPETLK